MHRMEDVLAIDANSETRELERNGPFGTWTVGCRLGLRLEYAAHAKQLDKGDLTRYKRGNGSKKY